MRRRRLLGLGAWAAGGALADWPQFRGVGASGISDGEDPPVDFHPYRNRVWRCALPAGSSSAVASRNQLFVTGYDRSTLTVMALDRKTGVELWSRGVARERRSEYDAANSPATPTPVTDGRNVYAYFGEFGLISWDADGNERWRRPLDAVPNRWGAAASPVLAGETLIVVCDGDSGSFVAGFDRDTGRERWRQARPEARRGWASPVVVNEREVLVAGSFRLTSYAAESGEPVWWTEGLGPEVKATPVVAGGVAYVLSGGAATGTAGSALTAWRMGGRGDRSASAALWRYGPAAHGIPSPLWYRGWVYLIEDGGLLTAIDGRTGVLGRRDWIGGAQGEYMASPVASDGRIYTVSREGRMAVIRAGARWELMELNTLDEAVTATPALVDRRLLVRTEHYLYAFSKQPW